MHSNSNLRFAFRKARDNRAGIALVIVLAFVLLLTVVVLTLLSRSLSNGLISGASVNFSKTDLYGHGAVNQVIGDLRQEIAAGSSGAANTQTITSGSVTTTIYRPASFAASVPANVGPSAYGTPSKSTAPWNTTFPNLVKESTRGVAFYPSSYDGNAPTRAAAINSSTDSSINGRYVSLARWNKHLLLPKASATVTPGTGGTATTISDSGTDTTPNSSFIAPDWILTAADGSNPTTLDTTSSLTTSNINPQSPKYVIGRYAYAIYNEGGLLDANVAGFPSTSSLSPAQQTPLFTKKGPAAFADLTVLPGIANTTSLTSQQVVNALVGWRNTATVQSTGTLPFYTLSSVGVGNYLQYLLGISTQFMTAGTNTAATASDRTFTSRQQLISFFQDIANGNTGDEAYLQDAMMYLGTFSRTLNQPSYWPDPTRPKIQALGGSTVTTYLGGNDATGDDNTNNPPFKSIRVGSNGGSAFTRYDGTPANVGDPLVKKRFPLNRLAWLTYKGPSAGLQGDVVVNQTISALGGNPNNSSDPITQYVNTTGTVANIYACFGLTWFTYTDPNNNVTSKLWVYNHSSKTPPVNPTTGAPTSPIIMTLSQVAKQGRDPDFIELLKAAICAGSLGKGCALGVDDLTQSEPYQFAVDVTTDYQILQIAANIIEQFKPDGFPVRIEDPASVKVTAALVVIPNWVACGSENLPYISGLSAIGLQIYPYNTTVPISTNTLATINDSGAGVILGLPILWNPYDQNSPTPSYNPTASATALSGEAPTSFQFFSPAYTSASSNSGLGVESFLTRANSANPMISDPGNFANMAYLTYANTLLTFGVPSGNNTLFREPTVLEQPGLPTGSNLAFGSSNAIITGPSFIANTQDSATAGANLSTSSGFTEYMNLRRNWIGIYCGQFPLAFYTTTTGTPPTPPRATNQTTAGSNTLEFATLLLGLQCPDGLGNMITYDQVYITPPAYTASLIPGTAAVWGASGSDQYTISLMDPRTSRFGGAGGDGYQSGVKEVDPTNHIVYSNRPDATNGSTYNVTVGEVSPAAGSGPGWTGSTSALGLFSQNNVATGTYYADPDGVVRRAMGAYASTTLNGSASGLPMAMAYNNTAAVSPQATQGESRPWMLHRPFRSVSELGYVFRGTPWKNLDFFTPESGDSALLDVFCINEDYRPDAVAAGRVDLNTKQAPVIQALLAGAYRDEVAGLGAPPTTVAAGEPQPSLTPKEAAAISQALVTRTTVGPTSGPNKSTPQPLSNIGDLVGRWIDTAPAAPINGSTNYDGFSADLTGLYSAGVPADGNVIQRLRESTMRALSDAGQAGTWNLLIDIIAQSGRYPINTNATNMAGFLVEGERHYWVHVAIDRSTGQVIDENIEPVNE
jgi:hypothetical protein